MAIYKSDKSMACNYNTSCWSHLICLFFLTGLATSSSSFISNDVLEAQGHSSRNLLQLKKPCNVSFENMDYSVITSKCKGPQYPAKPCCDALKEFSCPFVDSINDLNSDCATTMFSYINIYGKYPPGLFANECKEGKNGLNCGDVLEGEGNGAVHIAATQSSLPMLTAGLVLLLLQ